LRIEAISSPKSPKLKFLSDLREKSSLRRETSLFVVEGRREVERCALAGFSPHTLYICREAGGSVAIEAPLVCELSPQLYQKIALRDATEGVVGIFHERSLSLSDISKKENPLFIVLEGVEKPGNIGAVLRSADACGADALFLCDCPTDLYNPNLIRASLGAVFSVPTICISSAHAIGYFRENGVQILTAQLQDSYPYYDIDMTKGTAIVMGTEATGLTDQWREAATAHVLIPMKGMMDSLNVSVSAAILSFEALRQRSAKK